MKRKANVQNRKYECVWRRTRVALCEVGFHYLRIIREALCFLVIKDTKELTCKVSLTKFYNLNKALF
jgi:hypothetical protein